MGGWSKPLPAIKAKKGADDDEKRKAQRGMVKTGGGAPPKQRMGWHAILPLVAGVAWAAYQEHQNPTMGLAEGKLGVVRWHSGRRE